MTDLDYYKFFKGILEEIKEIQQHLQILHDKTSLMFKAYLRKSEQLERELTEYYIGEAKDDD